MQDASHALTEIPTFELQKIYIIISIMWINAELEKLCRSLGLSKLLLQFKMYYSYYQLFPKRYAKLDPNAKFAKKCSV